MGVTVDTSQVDEKLTNITKTLSRQGMNKLAKMAKREMKLGTGQAFSRQADPVTGRSWKARKDPPSWPALRHTGGLKRAIGQSAQVYGRKGTRMLVRSEVTDSRSGNRSYHAIAGAQFYGRRDQRKKMIGRGSSRGKGGPMPARRFSGITRAGKRRLGRRMNEWIRRT